MRAHLLSSHPAPSEDHAPPPRTSHHAASAQPPQTSLPRHKEAAAADNPARPAPYKRRTPRVEPQRAILPTLALALLWAHPAHAGNQDSFFLSNDAALTAGAVVALPGELGAPWYNPAGLASIPRSSVDVSASAFVLRLQDIPGALDTRLPDGTSQAQDLQNTQLLSVPSSLVFARRLSPKLALAFGVFVPSQESISLGTDTQTAVQPQDASTEYRQDLQLDAQVTRTHLGPSLAYSLSPDLRLGASVFGVYRLADLNSQHWAGYKGEPRGAAFGLQQQQSTSTGLGAEAVLGLQWNPTPNLHLGLTARSPLALFKLWTSSEELTVRASDPRNNPNLILLPTQAEAAQGVQLIAPARVHLAAGWLQDHLWLGAEADLTLPLDNQELGVQTRTIWNARLGARIPTSPNFMLGGGLFTDRSISPNPDALGELRVDYYGASFGAQWATPYPLATPREDGASDLTLSTTASLRYALGVGQAGGLRFEPSAPQGQILTDRPVDVVFHELGFHLGSTISF